MTINWPPGYALRDFQIEDMAAFPEVAKAMDFQYGEQREWLSRIKEPSFTLTRDGVPVCCAGVVLQERGVGTAWMFNNYEMLADRHHMILVRYVTREALSRIEKEYDLRRIEANADAYDPKAQAWLRKLSFAFEGRQRDKFGPGHDAFAYARVRRV